MCVCVCGGGGVTSTGPASIITGKTKCNKNYVFVFGQFSNVHQAFVYLSNI